MSSSNENSPSELVQLPSQLVPSEPGQPKTARPPKVAGGAKAVLSSMEYAYREAGLLRGRALLTLNQKGGFDCPSCAWPDPKHRAAAEFCENGARAVADEATTKTVTPEFFARYSISELLEKTDHWLNDQGRLTHPMIRRPRSDHYEPLAWDEVFETLGAKLKELEHPNRAVFYTSGRTSNEAAYLYQLFARIYGTNNLPDCSNMCHESSGAGLNRSIGTGKGTVLLEDFDHADVIVLIGQNPGTNHPRMLSALREAKLKGATIIAINPLEEVGLVRFKHPQKAKDMLGSGVALADLHLPVRVGGDYALLCGLAKLLIDRGQYDQAYIQEHTEGFEELKAHLTGLDFERLETDSGISKASMEAAAEILGRSSATLMCWAMGITQHQNGVANVQAVVNLLLLGGHFGRPGAGACPVRGHSNVQGDRTMGIWELLPPWFERLEERYKFSVPREMGFDVVGTIEAMSRGEVDVFFAMGGNFLSATPDTQKVALGLSNLDLTAHVSTKLNRSHLMPGRTGLILPCLGRTEIDEQAAGRQFVTVENSMSIVSTSEGRLRPASEHLLSEPRIVARLADATVGSDTVAWMKLTDDYDRIRDEVEAVVPGFENFNQRVRNPDGFVLPNPVREGGFGTKTGKGHFQVHELPELALSEGRLWLTTLRSHDQFNTTVYDLNDRYRGIYGHRHVIMMNKVDIERLGLAQGGSVRLTSYFQGETRSLDGFRVVPYQIPAGNAACYFPEANPLYPSGSFADLSRTPTSKRIEISVEATHGS